MIINPASGKGGSEIPVTSTPEEDVMIWIDPNEDDQTESFYNKAETENLLSTGISSHNTNPAAHNDIRNLANSKASTATYTVSIDASWSANSAGGYMKTVTVSGMLATDNPIADVVLGADLEANTAYRAAWGCITRITTAANSITLYANGEAPQTAFTMQLKVVR